MNTHQLFQELEPLNTQIEQVRKQRERLQNELSGIQTDLEAFSEDQQRFDALREVCRSLDRLEELRAGELFWKGIPEDEGSAEHLAQVRSRIDTFESKIRKFTDKQAGLLADMEKHDIELDFLYEEIQDAYDREERRQEEFAIEREFIPEHEPSGIMPWTKEVESERRFRRILLSALLACLLFGIITPIIKVPVPDPKTAVVEIPKRLAMLVKKKAVEIPPVPPKPQQKQAEKETVEEKPVKKETEKSEPVKKEDVEKAKKAPEKPDRPPQKKPQPTQVAKAGGSPGDPSLRKKVERVGVLKFKNSLKDLMAETTVTKVGTEARVSKQSKRVAGQARAQRSLVSIQSASGSSGGIANASISHNIGNGSGGGLGGGIGRGGGGNGDGSGTGFVVAESAIADLEETARPLSDGPGPGRTDEEIQIVFDRYKATLYRIYNRELRKDPTLKGKILLRLCIETNGSVSLCKVESTDLGSPTLVAKIVDRIEKINFGAKTDVPSITILYPIDFLPAG